MTRRHRLVRERERGEGRIYVCVYTGRATNSGWHNWGCLLPAGSLAQPPSPVQDRITTREEHGKPLPRTILGPDSHPHPPSLLSDAIGCIAAADAACSSLSLALPLPLARFLSLLFLPFSRAMPRVERFVPSLMPGSTVRCSLVDECGCAGLKSRLVVWTLRVRAVVVFFF